MIGTIEEVIRDMKKDVYDFTIDRECSMCGACCSDIIPVSNKEIKEIRRYIKKNHIKEQVHRFPIANTVLDMQCPFRDDENKICTIYKVRPAICRDFRCDKPRKKIERDKDLFHGRYAVIHMRETFFWEE